MDDLFAACQTSPRIGLAVALSSGLPPDGPSLSRRPAEVESTPIRLLLGNRCGRSKTGRDLTRCKNQTSIEMTKPSILILCTGNSCRSHLAEGILRAVAGDLLEVHSAGSKPAGYVHPMGIQVMREIGIDISAHHSKHMNDFLKQDIETVITVCGNADQACPMFPGQLNLHHWGFDDPAHAVGSDEEKLAVFRRVRDEIRRVFTAYADGRRDQFKAAK